MTRFFRLNRDEVLARLESWAQSLRACPEVVGVILFGSFARGDATAASDADVLVVLSDSPLAFEERIAHYRPTGLGVGVDVFCYTLAEIERGLRDGWGVAAPALDEGKTLYWADGQPALKTPRT